MKLIHCADIHLSSKINAHLTLEQSKILRDEIKLSFNKLLAYATTNNIHYILLSGDVFDSDKPFKKDKDFFYEAIKYHQNITFFYLRGNHDDDLNQQELPNLKCFGNEWKSYEIEDNVVITGIELNNNQESLYASLNLDKNKINIVMLHGDIFSIGKDYIDLKKLSGKNIDYLALGHKHTYQQGKIDSRGVYVYPGCLEGRGFDETDEKGFALITVNSLMVNASFVPFSLRKWLIEEFSLSDFHDAYEASRMVISKLKFNKNNLLRIVLKGEVDFDKDAVPALLNNELKGEYFYFEIINQCQEKIDLLAYKNELSLRGEFVREVIADQTINDEDKKQIIMMAFKALNNQEVVDETD